MERSELSERETARGAGLLTPVVEMVFVLVTVEPPLKSASALNEPAAAPPALICVLPALAVGVGVGVIVGVGVGVGVDVLAPVTSMPLTSALSVTEVN